MKESIQVVVNQLLKPLTLTLQSTLKKSGVHEEKTSERKRPRTVFSFPCYYNACLSSVYMSWKNHC